FSLFCSSVSAVGPLRDGTPEQVGMSTQRLEHVYRVVEEGVRTGAYPGAEILVVRKGIIVAHEAFGNAMRIPSTRPLHKDTLFDLASVSKLFTATATMMLVERGYIRLDDPISMFLKHPGFSQPDKRDIRIRHL